MPQRNSRRARVAHGLVIALVVGIPTLVTGMRSPAPIRVQAGNGLVLGDAEAYVTLGAAAALALPQFTIETWFRRDGAGSDVRTGDGGTDTALPLVTKGRGEFDGDVRDMNWFLGIEDDGDVLCADFEEGASGTDPGLNHIVFGNTPIQNGVWYHAAATYDGNTWRLYLNGQLDGELYVGQPVQSGSIQHAAIGSSLRSDGSPDGWFDGAVDEVRIWNHARSAAQIQSAKDVAMPDPVPGLVARYGLDQAAGTNVPSSGSTGPAGTIVGSSWSWEAGAPFGSGNNNAAPAAPVVLAPGDGEEQAPTSPRLQVAVTDADTDALTVRFYGRPAAPSNPLPPPPPPPPSAGPDFTLIALPDTQYYSASMNGGSPTTFHQQTQWIVDNRVPRNIAFVAHLGDCVQNGNEVDAEWKVADAAMKRIESPSATLLPDGIPYGLAPGNHDQSPFGSASGSSTSKFNQYFGTSRFQPRQYYGGHYGSNNDNNYALFSASDLDFIVVFFEYDSSPDGPVLDWADALLTQYHDRRAIIVSHYLMKPSTQGSFGDQGEATYEALKHHPNLFLMLCGHLDTEGRRTDTFNGNTVWTIVSDYQTRSNGGNGWLRIYTFSPANNEIRVQTYSPRLNQYETDSSSQFAFAYDMSGSGNSEPDDTEAPAPFTLLGQVSGATQAELVWPNLEAEAAYEWYVEVSDGNTTTTGPIWQFTTARRHTITASAGSNGTVEPHDAVQVDAGADVTFTMTPDPGYRVADVWVDGASRGALSAYTFSNVEANHTLAAAFEADPVSDATATQAEFRLEPLWPNPSFADLRIAYVIPVPTRVHVQVFDVRGRAVAELADRMHAPGRHVLHWNPAETGVAGGMYLVRVRAGGHELTQRAMIVR